MTDKLRQSLAHFSALAELDDEAWRRAMRAARLTELPAGAAAFRPGDPCQGYLLVSEGSIRVQMLTESGREIVLYRVAPGETCVLTTACLFANEAYPAEGIVEADALDAVKVVNSERVMPPFNRPGGPAEPRALGTPLIEHLRNNPGWIDPTMMGARLRESLLAGGGHEYLPFTGQSAGLIDDVLPAAEIVARTVAEAEAALAGVRVS